MSGTLRRAFRIGMAAIGLALFVLRWRRRDPDRLPARVRDTLVELGTTFVKLGQGLSLRWDLLTPPWRDALSSLHSHVPPFDASAARKAVETAFDAPIESLFAHFDVAPLAAASVAQIHAARLLDGREVVVKITRPGIRAQVDTDLRLLRGTMRVAQALWPPLRVQRPLQLVDELAQFLHEEIDMRHEAQNMRRMAAVIDGQPGVTLPHVVEPLCAPDVLVQERSRGVPLERAYSTPAAPELARALLAAYVHQLFAAGVFHADPHPGNLFVLTDGRLCFHDFGSVGVLDPWGRRALAALVEAIAADEADAALDAAIAMGFFGSTVERRAYEREIHLILSELASRPLAQWSVAEAIWRVARIGHGADFRLPPHLLVLMRTLFLVESTLRALDPELDLLGHLQLHARDIARSMAGERSLRRMGDRLARGARQLPELVAEWMRDAQLGDGRPAISVHHHGLRSTQAALARTGNRIALALVTLGLYLSGAVLTLHGEGPRVLGHVPALAAVAFAAAALLSLRLVVAINRSGHL